MELLPLETLPLGKKVLYESSYNPDQLSPIPREGKRLEIGINFDDLPFYGFDHWNHYEVSWLNETGKPVVALAQIVFKHDSVNLIESKSMKLYFNTFNNSRFKDETTLALLIKKDLEARVLSEVDVAIIPLGMAKDLIIDQSLKGICLDQLDIACSQYTVNPCLLVTEEQIIEETVYSDLLRSNCLVTAQPDWGSIQITYRGKKISHSSLLQYIVSFRNHHEFAEHCIERIFMDLLRYCKPEALTILIRYTRRGGIDINVVRATHNTKIFYRNYRLCRQ